MASKPQQTSTTALVIIDATQDHKVCVMDDGTLRILGDVSALKGIEARKIAYALMSGAAQV